jgi:ribosomal protein S6--L-glutamate ligase
MALRKVRSSKRESKSPAPAAAPAPPAAPPRRRKAKKTVVILSRRRSLYSTRRLVAAVRERGHRPLVLDTLHCNMVLAAGRPRILYRGEELGHVDVVIPRIGASITAYGLAVVNHFEVMGVPVLNRSGPIAQSRDKLRCLQVLCRHGLDIPPTVIAHSQ